ncbi:MAG TPA: hypothetical protein VGE59_04130 [Patescibacteria group bacterium]
MKHITARLSILLLITVLFGTGLIRSQYTHAQSPTGQAPKLFWSPERQAVLNNLKNDPRWFSVIKSKADAAIPSDAAVQQCFACYGTWPTLMYQMTGDTAYAQKAWQGISPVVSSNPPSLPADGSNGTRQSLATYALIYDWLKPALSAEQRQTFRTSLIYWSKLTIGEIPGTNFASGRLDDSDEVVGHYFGVIMTALTIEDEDPATSTFLINHPHVGGFDATSNSLDNKTSTMRNAIKRYAEMAQGGEWIESSDYNVNTVMLMAIGYMGVKTATETDHFPELASYFKEAAIQSMHILTPDLKQNYQWGDEQHPRDIRLYGKLPHMAALAAVNESDTTVAPLVWGAIKTLMDTYPNDTFVKTPPFTFFLFFNPAATPATDWQTKLARSHTTTNQGLTHFRTGWGNAASFFTSSFLNANAYVDHQQMITGDFQLYRKGEWAITHPIGYTLSSLASNVMRFSGYSATQEARGITAQEVDPNGTYVYTSGSAGGTIHRSGYWNPPATFLHEWTRSFLYLPSQDSSRDTVVIFDRTLADDPKQLYGWAENRYEGGARSTIENSGGRKEWILHTSEAPIVTGNQASWRTKNGQFIQLTNLLPTNTQKTIVNEKAPAQKFNGFIYDYEQAFHIAIKPTIDQQWDTFLSVVTAGEEANPATPTLIESADKTVQGVALEQGTQTTLSFFSAKPGKPVPTLKNGDVLTYDASLFSKIKDTRLIREAFQITTTTSHTSNLFIADLDPAQRWSLKINNTRIPFSVSEKGLGRATIETTGALSLAVIPNDIEPEGKASLEVTVAADSVQAKTGETLRYQVTYRNNGEKAASQAKFTTAIPSEFEVIEASLPTTPAVLQDTSTNTLTWTIPALAAGETGALSFQVKVKPRSSK